MYRVIVGIEVHVQIKTKTKAFCRCLNTISIEPNKNICPICIGEPGTLPELNRQMVIKSLTAALALHCKINEIFHFDRKNYFYPDLPKGYQITQYEVPIGYDGYLTIFTDDSSKRIGIERIHMEEDTGKMLHDYQYSTTLIDYNRAGIPLVEIVSKPDIANSDEAVAYVKMLKRTLEYLEVSDCSLESGSMRCDINISVNKENAPLSHKVEIKNLNSFNAIKKSIEYEIKRQTENLDKGFSIETETRLFNTQTNKTEVMRTKELAADYRYFREPDIPDITIGKEDFLAGQKAIKELPEDMIRRFRKDYSLTLYLSDLLTSDKKIAEYFEKTAKLCNEPLKTANIITTEIFGFLNDNSISIDKIKLTPEDLAKLIGLISKNKISYKAFKDRINDLLSGNLDIESFILESAIVTDDIKITEVVNKVINEQKDAVEKYLKGKESVFMFIVGQVMKELKGTGEIEKVKLLIKEKLDLLARNQKSEQ
jgi:aspartyl-tRNA(Asn)/glutamyl-tRNA(Gln) amidotransferase subunit B